MNKLFRVFFSSTFSDFVEERNALNKKVFPRLKELCAAHGARFQPIDLRWGIPDEVALQQSTMQICLDEIKRCQTQTPRPNFLIFLGERYGWTPPPAKIPKTEYDQISPHFSEEEKSVIQRWYIHDENELCKLDDGSVTTIYELQSRGKDYEEYEIWEPVEIKLRKILLQAAQKAGLHEKAMVKYYASATHQEIINGAIEVDNAETHIHCFYRELNGLPLDSNPDVYLESDPEIQNYLLKLKSSLQARLPSTIHKYIVDFGNESEKDGYLERFCDDVRLSLESTITNELESIEEVSALEEEINLHNEFGKNRSKIFVGREDILKNIIDYVKSDKRTPFVVYGDPGSGKSALIAKVFEELQKEKIDTELLIRFIGTTTLSSDILGLLRSICEQIIFVFGVEWNEEIPFEYIELKKTFRKVLDSIPERKRVVLLIDALDQLSSNDKGRDLGWIPQDLPENVKIITSFATDARDIMNIMEKKLPDAIQELRRVSIGEGETILDRLLANALRRLTPDQKKLVLKSFSEIGLPLYLKLAFEETCHWNSYDNINKTQLAPNIDGLIQFLFERLNREHTQEIVEHFLCFIVSSRNGLTEDEILDVMTIDTKFFEWYKNQIYHILPEEKLPWIVWSRFYSDIEAYMTVKGVDKTTTLVFFHRQFNEYVKKKLMSENAEASHHVLANYFDIAEFYYQKNGLKIPNYRKLSELIYNLRKAKMWKSLERNLINLEFIEAKLTAVMTEDLLNDYVQSFEDLSQIERSNDFAELKRNVFEFKQFLLNQAYILRKSPQLIAQQAINQPDISVVSLSGKEYIKSFTSPTHWFEWKNKPQELGSCIMTIAGHSSGVSKCAFSLDGTKILSSSFDGTLKLWNTATGVELRTFTGHSGYVTSCAFSHDGTKILSASSDDTLKIWDITIGMEIRTFTGHTDVWGCAYSPDGTKILSASRDNTLMLWDIAAGTKIRTFTGHSGWVNRCIFSPDGKKILSTSSDHSLKLWDVETGKELRTFIGHSDMVSEADFSPDGTRIISASGDHTLKLWNVETGKEIRTFTGHAQAVRGCAFSLDCTQILSASEDRTLKLWDAITGLELRTFIGHTSLVRDCKFSPDGITILSASRDKTLKIWNLATVSIIQTFTGHSGWIRGCAFSPDGTKLLSASNDHTLKLWDVETGKELRTFIGHPWIVKDCAFSPDGKKILSASWDHTLKLWDVETGKELRTFTGHSGSVTGCAFSPDGRMILSSSEDETLKLWEATTGVELRTYKGHTSSVTGCAFSPDGNHILSSSLDWTLKLWNVQTGAEDRFFAGHTWGVRACVFSPDGTKILSAADDQTLKLWDVASGLELRTFIGHSSMVNCCRFSSDGKKIISTSNDKTLRLWDIETGAELIFFPNIGDQGSLAINLNKLVAVGDQTESVFILQIKN